MKKTDKAIVAILGIWTFINCFLMLKTFDNPKYLKVNCVAAKHYDTGYVENYYTEMYINRKTVFYPFTTIENKGDKVVIYSRFFNTGYYDYTEFFVYVAGAWGLFLLYKLLSPKK